MSTRVTAALVALLSISGCHVVGQDPEVASLPPVFGARVTDGRLQVWTGTPCDQVTRAVLLFSPNGARLTLAPPVGQLATVEHLTLGGPYPGLHVTEPLPAGFDWHTAQDVDLILDSARGEGSTPTNISAVLEGSPEHPDDTYYFQGFGWLTPTEVSERNRRSLLTVCTADPAK